MAKQSNKAKGGAFERDIAKIISELCDVNAVRVPTGVSHSGDIMFIDILTERLNIEIKSRSKKPSKSDYNSWIEQSERDSLSKNKFNMIIYKVKNKGIYLMIKNKLSVENISTYNDYNIYDFKDDNVKNDIKNLINTLKEI